MEKKFTSDEVPIGQILDEARSGKLQLPDFQRGWVWDDDHISSLLSSISLSYPIGAVMTLQSGNPEVKFRPHPLEGVDLDNEVEPEFLLLDGQQRMTSLYLALKAGKPVPTRDAKGNNIERWYYADIKGCLDPFVDREEAIFGVPADRVVKRFGGEIALDLSSRDQEIELGMFPLSIVLDAVNVMDWTLNFLKGGPGKDDELLDLWNRFNQSVVTAFVQYQVPTIQLVKSTPKEAVCQVFEKVNTGGVSLSVFELLTATFAADDFQLRKDWEMREERLAQHPVLSRFSSTDFLQVVTLLATYQRRAEHLEAHPDDERVPPVSCKRRDVLRLSLAEYRKWAEVASDALERVVPLLHGEHIFEGRDLPYATQIAPLAAIFSILGDKAESHGVRQQLRRWYWCGVFGEMYGGSTETRLANDVQDVIAWIGENADEPRTVKEAQFQAARLLTLRSRVSAAYKGLFAMQMKRGCRDFRTGNPIDVHAYFDDAIDVHHIFPQKWCKGKVDSGIVDSVVNKTPIDSKTNKIIGGDAPSVYLPEIQGKFVVSAAELDEMLQSHDIDPVAMRQDDFSVFFNRRFERLLMLIEEAMGKPVNRSEARDESPFSDPQRDAERLLDGVRALMEADESKLVELKSTGRFNTFTGNQDPAIEWEIVRALAGFMNASGGTLLVGVDDDGNAVGIERDYPFLGKKPNRDGWVLWLTALVSSALGKVPASELTVGICEIDGHDIARIDVGPAPAEVFATTLKGERAEKFYARINNQTQELGGHDLVEYQRRRWPR